MLSIQYCQCNTINTILLVNVILLVNTILTINCKQLESFKVRAKFSSHPLQILFSIRSTFSFPIRSQSSPNLLNIRSTSSFQFAPNPI